MQKKYTSLGLMSGTSGDGVDASIIHSNGIDHFEVIQDRYFEYDSNIYKNIHYLKEKIFNFSDLKKYSEELKILEKKITIFHAKVIKELKFNNEDILVGFHGQTIYHNANEKVSVQLGDGRLLSQLTKRKVIFNFRQNDILNGGEGAPLAPIFHQLIATQNNIMLPVGFLNIGGISNITIIKEPIGSEELFSKDIGPGNCLIDKWVRKNSKEKYDRDGKLAFNGKTNKIIFNQAQELYANRNNKKKRTLDINDFDISFVRGLSIENGAATLTDFTANIIGEEISSLLSNFSTKIKKILLCGGGRKNKILLNKIKENLPLDLNLELIDKYKLSGDFIEAQAFAYLAIRSILKFPISFPNTTGCTKACSGGELIKN